MSKMEVQEDNEPILSKLDVVLNYTLEVRLPLHLGEPRKIISEWSVLMAKQFVKTFI